MKLKALIVVALGILDACWLSLTLHYMERHHAQADMGFYLGNWPVYSATEWWSLVSLVMFTVTTIATLWAAQEATKRTDPKMNVLADEPETAKSARPTQGEKSERENRESGAVR